MCSCILIITQTFSNFSVFPVVLLFALKVCVPSVGSHKCNFQISSPLHHILHLSLSPSYVAVRHRSPHSSHEKSCMGLSVLLMLDTKLRSRLVSEDITQIRSFFHKNHINDASSVVFHRNPVRFEFKRGPVFERDGSDVIWIVLSESGAATDASTEAPIYNPVLPLVLT